MNTENVLATDFNNILKMFEIIRFIIISIIIQIQYCVQNIELEKH